MLLFIVTNYNKVSYVRLYLICILWQRKLMSTDIKAVVKMKRTSYKLL